MPLHWSSNVPWERVMSSYPCVHSDKSVWNLHRILFPLVLEAKQIDTRASKGSMLGRRELNYPFSVPFIGKKKGHATIPNDIVTEQKTGRHPRKNFLIQAKWSTFPSPQPFNLCLISCVISGQWVKEQLNWIIRIISTCTASRLFACCMNHVQIEIIQEWDQTKSIS